MKCEFYQILILDLVFKISLVLTRFAFFRFRYALVDFGLAHKAPVCKMTGSAGSTPVTTVTKKSVPGQNQVYSITEKSFSTITYDLVYVL